MISICSGGGGGGAPMDFPPLPIGGYEPFDDKDENEH